jgi:flagellar motility protein MotE (MotC chaperone)
MASLDPIRQMLSEIKAISLEIREDGSIGLATELRDARLNLEKQRRDMIHIRNETKNIKEQLATAQAERQKLLHELLEVKRKSLGTVIQKN